MSEDKVEEVFFDDETPEGDELFEHHRFVADPGQNPLRVDIFLSNLLRNASRNKLQQAAAAGSIRVNDKVVKQNYRVKAGDEVKVVLAYPPRDMTLIPENIPVEIIHEDEEVIVINKEAGMVVHPGFGNYTGTLVNALMFHFEKLPVIKGGRMRPGLVHRLDKNTSGIMVIAATDFAMAHLARQFYERTSDRTYHALVWGDIKEDKGTITGNIDRHPQNRKIMTVWSDPERGKHAVTHYEVLKRYGYVTLVACKLETGRTHQIRVHMRHLGHPLFNDAEYGGDKILRGTRFSKYQKFIENCFKACPRHALHAKTLAFTHPTTGKRMEFDSEIPKDMQELMRKWENYGGN